MDRKGSEGDYPDVPLNPAGPRLGNPRLAGFRRKRRLSAKGISIEEVLMVCSCCYPYRNMSNYRSECLMGFARTFSMSFIRNRMPAIRK